MDGGVVALLSHPSISSITTTTHKNLVEELVGCSMQLYKHEMLSKFDQTVGLLHMVTGNELS